MSHSHGSTLKIRAGDDEPLEITVSATELDDLSEFDEGAFYARKVGSDANHVDGAALSVADSAIRLVSFDPVGNGPAGADAFALGDEGDYDCYVRITWLSGKESRFPGEPEMLRLIVSNTFE
jgi:hypothetical protein